MGWIDLGPQKNPVMISFEQEETGDRLNVYFTTMTVTRQAKNSRFARPPWRSVNLTLLEKILSE